MKLQFSLATLLVCMTVLATVGAVVRGGLHFNTIAIGLDPPLKMAYP